MYAVTSWIQSGSAWTADSHAGARITFGLPTSFGFRQVVATDTNGKVDIPNIVAVGQIAAGEVIALEFENFDTATRDLHANQILVQLIGTYTP